MKPLWTLTSKSLGISAREKKRGVLNLCAKAEENPESKPPGWKQGWLSLAPTQQQPGSLAQEARAWGWAVRPNAWQAVLVVPSVKWKACENYSSSCVRASNSWLCWSVYKEHATTFLSPPGWKVKWPKALHGRNTWSIKYWFLTTLPFLPESISLVTK